MRTGDHPAVNGAASASGLAHRFTSALAARDAAALRSRFGREVDFRALTPAAYGRPKTRTRSSTT